MCIVIIVFPTGDLRGYGGGGGPYFFIHNDIICSPSQQLLLRSFGAELALYIKNNT